MAIWKVPRLTSAQRATITPAASEILFDTDLGAFFGGDGVTVGGFLIASGSPNDTLAMVAGAALGGGRLARADATGRAVYADPALVGDMGKVLGVTLSSAALGAPVLVRFYGDITDPAWAWTPGAPIFAGAGGFLSQTVPAKPVEAFSQVVAVPLTATRIVVGLREPISLA